MPYLIAQRLDTRNIIAILAFGRLSYLEACAVLSDEMKTSRMVCDRLATLQLSSERSRRFERLAGVHKLGIPLAGSLSEDARAFQNGITEILEYNRDTLNFCVSLYCDSEAESHYDDIVSTVLEGVRNSGFKKANLLRPHSGYEMHARDVISRNALDVIIYRSGVSYAAGATMFIPEAEDLRIRATGRPVVSSEITLSPRLARVLINLASLSRGDLLLDPFCGSGTILQEAVLEGVNCVGLDRNPARVNNAKRNLAWTTDNFPADKPGSYSLQVGDAARLNEDVEGEFDAVVTEPILLPRFKSKPSLEKAKKAIRNASRIYSESLYSIAEVLKKGGRVVIVAPSLRTHEGKEVSLTLEGLEEIGLREFQPRNDLTFVYPVRASFESTRWIRRMVYVFERH